MISYPVRYNQDDECVEGSDFVVFARPHIAPGMSMEVFHEIGKLIADALNAYVPLSVPQPQQTEKLPPAQPSLYDLPPYVRESLAAYQRKALERLERKHRKMVTKMIAKAQVLTQQQTQKENAQ